VVRAGEGIRTNFFLVPTGLLLPPIPGVSSSFPLFHGKSIILYGVSSHVHRNSRRSIGVVDYGDLTQEVRLDLVNVDVGEFVLVHVGFAIQKLSREEGLETREIFRQVYAAMEE
jgi:hydrogenase expression/formation protein HypC